MVIKLILIIYILFVSVVSFMSHKKGILLVWLTFLVMPTVLLHWGVVMRMSFQNILMVISIFSVMRILYHDAVFRQFVSNNTISILIYLTVMLIVTLFSDTVPISIVLRRWLNEIIMLIFGIFTFLIIKDCKALSRQLLMMVYGIIVFHALYCFLFEIILRINPAGSPLYYALGQQDNEFLVDMIDFERGFKGFRAQTLFGHALSLGQYMLILTPLLFVEVRVRFKFLFILLTSLLVVLSGTRGAIVPLFFVLIIGFARNGIKLNKYILISILALPFIFSLMPKRQMRILNQQTEGVVAGMMFWDDNIQKRYDIRGSSMELREYQFKAATEEIKENPLFGRGMGYREFWQKQHGNFVHPKLLGYESVILYYLVERGCVGLIFFFVVTGYLWKFFRKSTIDKISIDIIFISYLASIMMTGIRPLSFLLVFLSSSILCGIYPSRIMNAYKIRQYILSRKYAHLSNKL